MSTPKNKLPAWAWLILLIPIPAFLLPWYIFAGAFFAALLTLAYFGWKTLYRS